MAALRLGTMPLVELAGDVADTQAAGRWPTQDNCDRDNRESCIDRLGCERIDAIHKPSKLHLAIDKMDDDALRFWWRCDDGEGRRPNHGGSPCVAIRL